MIDEDDTTDDDLLTFTDAEFEGALREAAHLAYQKGRQAGGAEVVGYMRFAAVLRDDQRVLKALESLPFAKAWSEQSHPRDDAGRFVSAKDVRDATRDPEKAKELRASVTNPEQRKKLESLLADGGKQPLGGTDRSSKERLDGSAPKHHDEEGKEHVAIHRGAMLAAVKRVTEHGDYDTASEELTETGKRAERNNAIHWREAKKKAIAQFASDYPDEFGAEEADISAAFDAAEATTREAYKKLTEAADWVAYKATDEPDVLTDSTAPARVDFEAAYSAAQDAYTRATNAVWDVIEKTRDDLGGKEKGWKLGRYFKAWSEAQHPRSHGQFASEGAGDESSSHGGVAGTLPARPSGGGDALGDGRAPPGNSAVVSQGREVDPDAKARTLAARIAEAPHAVALKVRTFLEGRYAKLAARYGDTGAKMVMGAIVLLLPVPVPGSSLLPVAIAEAVLRVRQGMGGEVKKAWNESQHARGRPENAGEFTAQPDKSAVPEANTKSAPSDEHRATAEKLVGASNLPPELAAEYTARMTAALHKLPAGARSKALASITGATFHPNTAAVKAQFVKDGGAKSQAAGLLGYVRQPKGSGKTHLNLDGAVPGSTDPQYTIEGVYLHELGHAADPDCIHSADPKWATAWKREIKSPPAGKQGLTRYAMTDESEGFAELVRVISQKGTDATRARFPKCVAFLESKGLL